MVGGIIGLIATIYLKPRRNRFNEDSVHQMSSPTNALLGQSIEVSEKKIQFKNSKIYSKRKCRQDTIQ